MEYPSAKAAMREQLRKRNEIEGKPLRSIIMRGDQVVSEELIPAYGQVNIIARGGHVNFHNVTHEKKVE